MKRIFAGLICLSLLSIALAAQQYFPAHAFDQRDDMNKFVADWYSTQLRALEEPSLWELSQNSKQQVYRFLYLRSFHHPIAVRLEVQPDGSSILTAKMADGAGGYAPGKLIENQTKKLTKDQTKFFLDYADELNYWNLPPKDPKMTGFDGAEWIIEATRHGKYKIVDRWSPKDGPIRTLGLRLMIDLADLPLLYKEVY